MRFRPFLLTLALALPGLGLPLQAATLTYFAALSGAAEFPPNASPGTGSVTVTLDTTASTLHMIVKFRDLLAPVTVAHIHGPTAVAGQGTAGVMTSTPSFPGFPVGVTSGRYDMTFNLLDASSYNPNFVNANVGLDGARLALIDALAGGKAYFNLHTSQFSGGEIRGFLQPPAPVPLPASLPLLAGALLLAGGALAHRRQGRGRGQGQERA